LLNANKEKRGGKKKKKEKERKTFLSNEFRLQQRAAAGPSHDKLRRGR
jgi:hypothetical protein